MGKGAAPHLARLLLERDFKDACEYLRENPTSGRDVTLRLKEQDKVFCWHVEVSGERGTVWDGLLYDVEIAFSRRHPFEPPSVFVSKTSRNLKQPRHRLVDPTGRVALESLTLDRWLPTTSCRQLITWVVELFSSSSMPSCSSAHAPTEGPLFSRLSRELVRHVMQFMHPKDICALGATCKNLLSVSFSEPLWAVLFYQRDSAPYGLLRMSKDLGPIRVLAENGLWYWKDARDQFIRTQEMAHAQRGPCSIVCPDLKTFAYRDALACTGLLHFLTHDEPPPAKRSWVTAMIGGIKARREAMCRVVGRDVPLAEVQLPAVERLYRMLQASGLSVDMILHALDRTGLLHLLIHESRRLRRNDMDAIVVAPGADPNDPFAAAAAAALGMQHGNDQDHSDAEGPFSEPPTDTEELRPATLEDYLNVCGSLLCLATRSFRCFTPAQRVDVNDHIGQWLSAVVLGDDRNFRQGMVHFDWQKIINDVKRDSLHLHSLLRLQSLSGVSAYLPHHGCYDGVFVSDNLDYSPVVVRRNPLPSEPADVVVAAPDNHAIVAGPFAPAAAAAGGGDQQAQDDHEDDEDVDDDIGFHDAGELDDDEDDHDAMLVPVRPPPTLAHAAAFASSERGPSGMKKEQCVLVHYEGHRESFDEWIPWSGERVKPWRTHTHRPITLASEATIAMVQTLNHDEICFQAKPASIELRVESFWSDMNRGGGRLRYLVPSTMRVGELLLDFCEFFDLPHKSASMVKVRGNVCGDYRRSKLQTILLQNNNTLVEAGVGHRDVLNVVVTSVGDEGVGKTNR